ncbi:MAG: UUP1 family membrane protein [Bdellovibrionota bacterium]
MRNTSLYIYSALLAAIGLSVFLYKIFVLNFPVTPNAETAIWTIESRVFFSVREDKPVKLELLIPKSTPKYTIHDESFVSWGYGLTTEVNEGNRTAVWSIRRTGGEQYLFYRGVIRQVEGAIPYTHSKSIKDIEVTFEGPELIAAEEIVAEAQSKSADLKTFMTSLLKRLNTRSIDENVRLLLGSKSNSRKKVDIAGQLCVLAGHRARIVNGVLLEDAVRDAQIESWLEVNNDDDWQEFSFLEKDFSVPENALAWWYGSDPLYSIKGGQNVHVSVSVRRNFEGAVSSAVEGSKVKTPFFVEFSLFNLPIDVQSVFQILLLVPFGAFLVVIARNIVGVPTFGTFMPILIALAFRETDLVWGVILFSFIVAVGLLVRFALDRLRLLLVPRLASVLIIVILILCLISLINHKLGFERGVSVALFPVVILTMTIERMCVVWEEQGPNGALKQAIGSLFVASIVYLIFNTRAIAHITFVFPEVHLIILAAVLLLGRFSGYRLTEYMRYKYFLGR